MPRIVALASAVAILFLTAGALAAEPLALPKASPPAANNNASVDRPLDRAMPDLRLNGSSFGDVIDFLSDVSGINMAVDWKALSAANVTKETPITLRLGSTITLRKALKLVLQEAAGAGVLTFYPDQGVLEITTQESADKQLITRIYGIQDLLFTATDYTNVPNLDITSASQGQQGGRGGGGGGQQIFQNGNMNSNQQKGATQAQRAQEIINLITTTVRPEVWQVNGGTATISFIRGNLVVSAPRSVHEQLSSN